MVLDHSFHGFVFVHARVTANLSDSRKLREPVVPCYAFVVARVRELLTNRVSSYRGVVLCVHHIVGVCM